MEILRKDVNEMFEKKWCPICAKVTDMKPIFTNLPGIVAQQCECGIGFQANYLEDDNDLLTIPDTFVLMPKCSEDGFVDTSKA